MQLINILWPEKWKELVSAAYEVSKYIAEKTNVCYELKFKDTFINSLNNFKPFANSRKKKTQLKKIKNSKAIKVKSELVSIEQIIVLP